MTPPSLPEQIELHRDRLWRRDEDLRVESAVDAERFIGDVPDPAELTPAKIGIKMRSRLFLIRRAHWPETTI